DATNPRLKYKKDESTDGVGVPPELRRPGERGLPSAADGLGEAKRLPRVLDAEADLQADLEVLDLALDDLATHLGHLEPVQVAQRRRRTADGIADRGVDALMRAADDFGDAVGVVG